MPVADAPDGTQTSVGSDAKPFALNKCSSDAEADAEGARLVSEIASAWCSKYIYTIRRLPPEEKTHHYECLLSQPTNDKPVPRFVISVFFSLITSGEVPRLLFAFEDSDLRHEWTLTQDPATGSLRPKSGQQFGSLRHGTFEQHLDFIVDCRSKVRETRVSLETPFEATRLCPPSSHDPLRPDCRRSKDPLSRVSFQSKERRLSISRDSSAKLDLLVDNNGFDTVLGNDGINSARATYLESTSLLKTPSGPSETQEMAEAIRHALKVAGFSPDQLGPRATLEELLTNIFDAADEDCLGVVPHHEVASLLGAMVPGLGLEPWDISELMASAEENDEGFIEYKPFIAIGPDIIKVLRKRRLQFAAARTTPEVELQPEAIQFCFGDEVALTVEFLDKCFQACAMEDASCGVYCRMSSPSASPSRQATKVERSISNFSNLPRQPPRLSEARIRRSQSFSRGQSSNSVEVPETLQRSVSTASRLSFHPFNEVIPIRDRLAQLDAVSERRPTLRLPAGARYDPQEMDLIGLSRRACRECLESALTRVSPQEVRRLMQTLPEDECGFIQLEEVAATLESLRKQALLNAIVETDEKALRSALLQQFFDPCWEGSMKLWDLKKALFSVKEVCLSRLQIHVLLCLAPQDDRGYVDPRKFLGICCAVIPHMFDAKGFVETAERLQVEYAEEQKARENAELAALGAAKVLRQTEEETEEKEMDQDTVEKILIQALSLSADARMGDMGERVLPARTMYHMLSDPDAQVASCGITPAEMTGLLAEMSPGENLHSTCTASGEDGEVMIIDHIKRWVPVLFELRKNGLLKGYLKEDAFNTLGIPNPLTEELLGLGGDESQDRESSKESSKESKDSSDKCQNGRSRRRCKTLPVRSRFERATSMPDVIHKLADDHSSILGASSTAARLRAYVASGKKNPNTYMSGISMMSSTAAKSSTGRSRFDGEDKTPHGRGQRRRLLRLGVVAANAELPAVCAS